MSLTNEDLLAISQLMDAKLQPIKNDITSVKVSIETEIEPKIQLLAENYVPAAKRYVAESEKIEAIQSDVDILKKVVTEHSEKLQQLA